MISKLNVGHICFVLKIYPVLLDAPSVGAIDDVYAAESLLHVSVDGLGQIAVITNAGQVDERHSFLYNVYGYQR